MARLKAALLVAVLGVLATPQPAAAFHYETAQPVRSKLPPVPVSCGYICIILFPGEGQDPDCWNEDPPEATPGAVEHVTQYDGRCHMDDW